MYFAGVLCAVFFCCVIGYQISGAEIENRFACEDEMAELNCRLSNQTIEISSLFYGRNPRHGNGICLTGAPQSACEMIGFDKEEKLNNLKKACNGKSHCNIHASDLTFGDRHECPNVTKYLSIIYKCIFPPITSTREPSTKEPIYYTGTSRPGSTSTKPTAEPYMDLHKLDEDGNEWPTPRARVECNTTVLPTDDDEDLDSAASPLEACLHLIVGILVWKVFL